MAGMLSSDLVTLELAIPQSRSDLVARLHREANVLRLDYVGNDVHLIASLSQRAAIAFEKFVKTAPTPALA